MSYSSSSVSTIPVTVIAGYLGAGKTTLLNRLLSQTRSIKIQVLVNDFGSINIDAELIESRNANAIQLSNGCACCSIGNDLLAATKTAIDTQPDLIIIEASGVSEPLRIKNNLLGLASLQPAHCVVVADAGTIKARSTDKFVGRLVLTQLISANLVLSNREPVDHQDRQEHLDWLSEQTLEAPVITSDSVADTGDNLLALLIAKSCPLENSTSNNAAITDPSVDASAAALNHGINTAVWQQKQTTTQLALERALSELPSEIHRAKGFARIKDPTSGLSETIEIQYAGLQRRRLSPFTGKRHSTGGTIVLAGQCNAVRMANILVEFNNNLNCRTTTNPHKR